MTNGWEGSIPSGCAGAQKESLSVPEAVKSRWQSSSSLGSSVFEEKLNVCLGTMSALPCSQAVVRSCSEKGSVQGECSCMKESEKSVQAVSRSP